MSAEFIAAIIVFIISLILAIVAITTMRKGTFVSREAQLEQEVKELRAALALLNRDRVEDARKIQKLESELISAKARITELEQILKKYEKDEVRSERALLVGIGDDPNLRVDLAALRAVKTKTGLGFSRIMPVTFEKLHGILADARMRGKPYPYLHLSVHANPDSVLFDRHVSALELSEELQDVRILVIAGCQSNELGMLLGVVPTVITMRENIPHDDAMRFTEAFWTNIGFGVDHEDAFYDAIDKVPNVQEYAEIHN